MPGIRLKQESASTGSKHLSHYLVGVLHGKNQDRNLRQYRQNLAGGFQSIQVRHPNVEKNHIRFHGGGEFDRFSTISGFRTDFPAWMTLQECADAPSCHFMIIRNQDSKHYYTSQAVAGSAHTNCLLQRTAVREKPTEVHARSAKHKSCQTHIPLHLNWFPGFLLSASCKFFRIIEDSGLWTGE